MEYETLEKTPEKCTALPGCGVVESPHHLRIKKLLEQKEKNLKYINEYQIKRYKNDEEYREKKKAYRREYYKKNKNKNKN